MRRRFTEGATEAKKKYNSIPVLPCYRSSEPSLFNPGTWISMPPGKRFINQASWKRDDIYCIFWKTTRSTSCVRDKPLCKSFQKSLQELWVRIRRKDDCQSAQDILLLAACSGLQIASLPEDCISFRNAPCCIRDSASQDSVEEYVLFLGEPVLFYHDLLVLCVCFVKKSSC